MPTRSLMYPQNLDIVIVMTVMKHLAIDAGFDNPDPAVQEEWKKMTLKGDRPTPEEVINYAVKKLKGK